MSFTHLHLNSCYSIGDSIAIIENIVDRVKELGQTSVAITDRKSILAGVVLFFESCIKNGIKPIIGTEIDFLTNITSDKTNSSHKDEIKIQIVLLCKNEIGYKNLVQITNITNIDGLYDSHLNYEELKKYSDGLICLLCRIEGKNGNLLLEKQYDEIKYIVTNLKKIFGSENFFLEIQNHKFECESIIQSGLIKLSKEFDIGLVATNCCKYVLKEDCVVYNHIKYRYDDCNSIKDEDYYITSEDEMRELFKFCPEAVENTKIIADRCNVKLEFAKPYYSFLINSINKNYISNVDKEQLKDLIKICNYHIPKYDVPNGFTNKEYLTKLAMDGLYKKYNLNSNQNGNEIIKRLNYELSVINENGYTDYFLIVADYVKYAIDNGIIVRPGRGSAVSSLVCYVLSITDVDPIKNNLFFERFINTERDEGPYIYICFSIDGLEKIRKYLKDKYGNENVLNISLDSPFDICRLAIIPTDKKCFVPQIVNIHNANTCFSIVSQYDTQTLEKLGFVIFDLVGLRHLDIIKSCIDNVKVKNNIDIDFNKISYNDEKVYNMISSGETKDVFILEGDGMIEFIKELRPNKFSDLVIAISVYRPGPDKYIDELVKRKNESQFIERIHPVYDEILVETYGKIIYQEQIMEIFHKLSGMSLSMANTFRRSLAKKKSIEVEDAKKCFIYGNEQRGIKGCVNNGVSEEIANKIFENILESAGFAFIKSHAVAFAKLAYETAYLKYYYKDIYYKCVTSHLFTN